MFTQGAYDYVQRPILRPFLVNNVIISKLLERSEYSKRIVKINK